MKQAETASNDNYQTAGAEAQLQQLRDEGLFAAQGQGSPLQTFLVHAIVVYCLVLALLNTLTRPGFILWLPLVIVLIDFLSGLVHWFFDTQVKPGHGLLGRVAVDFLDHHVNPGRTAEVGYIVSALRPALWVSLPLCTIATLAPLQTAPAAVVFWIGLISMWVPQAHKIAHLPETHSVISRLQQFRLILNPQSHQRHHDNNSQGFCVFTGWLNPLLDRSGFWRRMESWSTSAIKALQR